MTDAQAELRVLGIQEIVPYEHNPRQSANPEYESIKASIRVDGMTQPLVVTQRPGDDSFMVGAGGNTRLRIVKELLDETQDPRFAKIPCRVIPWKDDAEVLLAHLKENDLRGNLNFVDRARAVVALKHRMETEEGVSELSHRALATALTARGYRSSHPLVIDMSYAVEKLGAGLPVALSSGLSRAQVQRIRLLDRACRILWDNRVADEDPFDDVFTVLCRRHDGPHWDLASLRRSLELEIADRSETSVQQVSLVLEAYLDGRQPESPAVSDQAGQEPGAFDTEIREVARQAAGTETRQQSIGSEPESEPVALHVEQSADPVEQARAGQEHAPLEPEDVPSHSIQAPPTAAGIAETIQSTLQSASKATTSQDIKSLRARAWTLAARLAQRNGIGELIQAISRQGLGYMVIDVPAPALADHLDKEDLARVAMLWWQLVACAEVTVAPVELVVPHLDPDSVLKQALEEQDGDLLFDNVWTLDPGHTGYRLWRHLDDRDWQDYVGLIDNYRSLYRVAAQTQTALWS